MPIQEIVQQPSKRRRRAEIFTCQPCLDLTGCNLDPDRAIYEMRRRIRLDFEKFDNPIYIGQICHKATVHDGLHPRLVNDETWQAVLAKLADNRNGDHHVRAVAEHPSILAGNIFDEAGQKMVPSHANKGSRRYRYYISQNLQPGGDAAEAKGRRIPAQ